MTPNDDTAPVLVLDDDPFVREVASMLLKDAGYPTVQARSARDATSLLAETRPSLAIVDYRLPGVDGATWIQDMRAANVKIPMVLLSGSVLDSKTINMLRSLLDVRLVLKKPIEPDKFIEQISPLLPPVKSPSSVVEQTAIAGTEPTESNEHPDLASGGDKESINRSQGIEIGMAALREEYVLVAKEDACRLHSLLLELSQSNLPEPLGEAASIAHRFRGSAGCYGFQRIGDLAGQIEDLLRAIEGNELPWEPNHIVHLLNAWELECADSGLSNETSDGLKSPNVLMVGSFTDKTLTELNSEQKLHSLITASPDDALRHLQSSLIDLVCIEQETFSISEILPIAFEARRAHIPMVLSTQNCALQKAERIYLGDSWANMSAPDAVSFFSELELASTMKDLWKALNTMTGMSQLKPGYAFLPKQNFICLVREILGTIRISLALMEIEALDEIGFLQGTDAQNSIASAARNLLRSRFRFEDIRCPWSPDKLLIALPGLPLDLSEASVSLFAKEFDYFAFQGKDGRQIYPKVKFAVIGGDGSTSVDDLLESVYRKLHPGTSDNLMHTRAA